MKKNIFKILHWLTDEVVDFFQNLARDVKSLRSLLNWIYCLTYIWLVWYCVTHYKESANTAIMTTGTIVSAIFAGYVFTKSYEKVKGMTLENENAKISNSAEATKPNPNEDGADA